LAILCALHLAFSTRTYAHRRGGGQRLLAERGKCAGAVNGTPQSLGVGLSKEKGKQKDAYTVGNRLVVKQ
jgi:hypothetical protein